VPRQVEVEVTVMEVALNSSLQLAFDAFLPLTDPDEPDDLIAFLSMTPSGSFGPLFSGSPVAETLGGVPAPRTSLLGRYARSPIFLPVTLPNGQTRALAIPRETAAVTADERDVYQRTILRPHLKLISGEEHEIFVGDNVPIRTEQAESSDPLQIRQNIERQDTGVTLRVTPTLGEEGAITLDLMVEVSAVVESMADSGRRVDLGDFDGDGYGGDGDGYGGSDGGSVGVGDPTVVGPTIQKRTLTTKVRLEHNRIAVIGYQSGPRQVDVVSGTPFFKDIPILGWLFKSTTTAAFNNHLLITVSAWRDDEEIQALSATLRRALASGPVEVARPVADEP
jgi:type II secretory pathway component GspD/PulD (secretin)